jgi:DNA-binding response OmpR family regulator
MHTAAMKKKVLIIDDEVDFATLMKNYFLRKGYEVYIEHTLEAGKKRFKEIAPTYVFYDGNSKDFDDFMPPRKLRDIP